MGERERERERERRMREKRERERVSSRLIFFFMLNGRKMRF